LQALEVVEVVNGLQASVLCGKVVGCGGGGGVVGKKEAITNGVIA